MRLTIRGERLQRMKRIRSGRRRTHDVSEKVVALIDFRAACKNDDRRCSFFRMLRRYVVDSAALTALKFGRSLVVAVCSAYFTNPSLPMTNAARADVSPTAPAKSTS